MADDITAKRAQVTATRARIDDHLDELTGHVPARDQVVAVATKYGAAVGGVVAAVGVLVLVTKSKLAGRATKKAGAEYARALVAAFPEVAEAYRAKVSANQAAAALVDVDTVLVEAAPRPRGGAPTAMLTGLGVVAGVAISKVISEG